MKYFAGVALAVLGAILLGCSGNGSTGDGSDDHHSEMNESSQAGNQGSHHGDDTADSAAVTDGNTTCPVMEGDAVDPEIFTTYKGRKVYFCCDDCVEKFKRDPEAYFSKVYPDASGN